MLQKGRRSLGHGLATDCLRKEFGLSQRRTKEQVKLVHYVPNFQSGSELGKSGGGLI